MNLNAFIAGGDPADQKRHKSQIEALAQERAVKYFVEKGSADRNLADRVELLDAIEESREPGSTFAIATLTNFSTRRWKGLELLNEIADEGINIEVADDPTITSSSIAVLALSAQVAREKILQRSAEALQRIKDKLSQGETHVSASGRKIRKLGARSQAELSRLGNDVKVDRANQFAEDMRPYIEPLVARGMSLSAIASHLNRLGIKTSKGGRFYQSTVSGILRRLRHADKRD